MNTKIHSMRPFRRRLIFLYVVKKMSDLAQIVYYVLNKAGHLVGNISLCLSKNMSCLRKKKSSSSMYFRNQIEILFRRMDMMVTAISQMQVRSFFGVARFTTPFEIFAGVVSYHCCHLLQSCKYAKIPSLQLRSLIHANLSICTQR